MSEVSLGKFKDMLDSLVRDFSLKGKGGSLLTGERHFQHSTGLLFISQLRGKERREAAKVP